MTAFTVRLGMIRRITLHSFTYMFFFSQFVHAGTAPEATNGSDFHLKGVLVSQSARSALVNNKVLREGERLGNIEILAIGSAEVEIRMGSRRLTVPVGSRASWDRASRFETASPAARVAQSGSATPYGPVKRGETLSEIAETLLGNDVTMNQMMVALYDANPEAFAGNINILREGALLQIPARDVLQRRPPAVATAEVLRQTETWQGDQDPGIRLSKAPDPEVYGPVNSGETLSGIAVDLSRDGTSMNQMMIALFEANPQAFDGNINLLKAGAVLRIPDEAALLRHSHATATATVVHHMDAIRHGAQRQPEPIMGGDDLSAFHDARTRPPDAVLVSMRSRE